MAKNCDFGKEIKKKLVDIDRTQAWLIEKVREDTGGMYIDDSYLYRIMKGDANPPKIIASIKRILKIN